MKKISNDEDIIISRLLTTAQKWGLKLYT